MYRYFALLISLLLGACSLTSNQPSDNSTSTNNVIVVDGPSTAAALTALYMDNVSNCGSNSTPAFLCSGVILRATIYSDSYDAWNPSPTAKRKGSVSFSYLRRDNNFQHFVYNAQDSNGFIFYPIFDTPTGKLHIDVLCHYPNDGWSDNRWADGNGCGSSPGLVGSGPSCAALGITTGAQWGAKYPPGTPGPNICSFDVRDSLNEAAGPAFYAALQSKWMNSSYFTEQNEMLLKLWGDNLGSTLPIRAFFYGKPAGLQYARKNKQRFLQKTGINLPIIKITLPTTPQGLATFQYIAADQ